MTDWMFSQMMDTPGAFERFMEQDAEMYPLGNNGEPEIPMDRRIQKAMDNREYIEGETMPSPGEVFPDGSSAEQAPVDGNDLNKLAEFYAQKDLMELQRTQRLEEALTPEVKKRIEDIEAEFSQMSEGVKINIDNLETKIKKAVLDSSATLKGSHLMAVWTRGRITWDAKSMDGYAVGHPEILYARKEGEPFVAIRKVQSKEKD